MKRNDACRLHGEPIIRIYRYCVRPCFSSRIVRRRHCRGPWLTGKNVLLRLPCLPLRLPFLSKLFRKWDFLPHGRGQPPTTYTRERQSDDQLIHLHFSLIYLFIYLFFMLRKSWSSGRVAVQLVIRTFFFFHFFQPSDKSMTSLATPPLNIHHLSGTLA